MQVYTREEVYESLLEHFEDSLQASTFLKYILQDKHGNYYEKHPEESLKRLSRELARVELNYPNPFVNYTEFWFNHNKTNELLNVQIQIFTVSGKLVKTINETVQSEGNLSRTIAWNGLDDYGSKIGKGVYVYKLKVKSLNSNAKSEKIEKLVILQ